MKGRTKNYEMIDRRYIHDFDGFTTDLSLWKETDTETEEEIYFVVFGDLDLYGPTEGEDYNMSNADWVEENYKAAMDFFYDYRNDVE